MIKRTQLQVITSRIKEQKRFIQVIAGPRQVGKTNGCASNELECCQIPSYSSVKPLNNKGGPLKAAFAQYLI